MSVVVNVCGSNFSIMVSDNRLVKYDNFGHIEIVSENCRKIHRINENILIGFTGDAIQCQNVYNEIIKNNVSKLTLEQVKEITKNILFEHENEINELGVRIILSGKQLNNKFITYVVDSNNGFNETLYDPDDNMCLIYAVPKAIDCTHNYGGIIESAINDNKFSSSNELVKIIGKAIYDISKLNPGVNNIITYEVISWMNENEIIVKYIDKNNVDIKNIKIDNTNNIPILTDTFSNIKFEDNFIYQLW